MSSTNRRRLMLPTYSVKTLALVALGAGLFLSALTLVSYSFRLRPIADDYSFGQKATFGLIGGVVAWWREWMGELVSTFVQTLLIGLPMLYLPLGVASSIGFILTGVAVGLLANTIFGPSLSRSQKLLAWFATTVGWWVSFEVGTLLASDETSAILAGYSAHWQSVNVPYVLLPAVITATILLLSKIRWRNAWSPAVVGVVVGCAIGLTGAVFSASVAALAVVYGVLRSTEKDWRTCIGAFALAGGILASIAVSTNSPGALNRKTRLPKVDLRDLFWGAFEAGPRGLSLWIDALVSFESLLGLTLGLVFAFASGVVLNPATKTVVLSRATFLVILSLTASVVNAVAEIAAYRAAWHMLAPRMLLFVAAVAAGVLLLQEARRRWGSKADLRWVAEALATAVTLTVLLLVASGTVGVVRSIQERAREWETGSAPILGAVDRETDWVMTAWEQVRDFREGR